MQSTHFSKYLKLHFIILIWGFTAVLGALIQLDYFSLTWYRMGLAILILGIYVFSKKEWRRAIQKLDLKEHLRLFLGGIIIALHWIAFFYAIKVSNVSITLITLSTGAFFTSLLEPLFFKRKIYFYEVLFGLLILGGFLILVKVEEIKYVGVIFGLIAAFLSGLFSVVNGIYIRRESGILLSFFQLFYGFAFLTIIMLLTGKFNHLPIPSTTDWFYLIILASICTAYAFTASISLMKYLSPFTVMISINLEPVYGILLAVLFLGEKEKMSPGFYVGGLIILIIILLNAYVKYFRKSRAE